MPYWGNYSHDKNTLKSNLHSDVAFWKDNCPIQPCPHHWCRQADSASSRWQRRICVCTGHLCTSWSDSLPWFAQCCFLRHRESRQVTVDIIIPALNLPSRLSTLSCTPSVPVLSLSPYSILPFKLSSPYVFLCINLLSSSNTGLSFQLSLFSCFLPEDHTHTPLS